MLSKFFRFFAVLKEGESLIHSATWKNRQVVLNAISVVLVFTVSFMPSLDLSPEDIKSLATAIAIVGGVINGYLTVATSDKVGIAKSDDEGSSGSGLTGTLPLFDDKLPSKAFGQ